MPRRYKTHRISAKRSCQVWGTGVLLPGLSADVWSMAGSTVRPRTPIPSPILKMLCTKADQEQLHQRRVKGNSRSRSGSWSRLPCAKNRICGFVSGNIIIRHLANKLRQRCIRDTPRAMRSKMILSIDVL